MSLDSLMRILKTERSRNWYWLNILFPLGIWSLVLILPFTFRIGNFPSEVRSSMYKTVVLSNVLLIIIFYVHHFLIYPVKEKRYGLYLYVLLLAAIFIVFLLINHFFYTDLSRFPRPEFPKPGFHKPGFPGQFFGRRGGDRPLNVLTSLLPFTFVIVMSFCFRLYSDKVIRDKQIEELENLHLKTELEFLSSQISPHFMFNVLNTLVYMSRKKPELVEPSLISLSQMMRYMVYDSDEGQITLADEIEYLKNYSNLQLLRFGDSVRFNLYLSGAFEQYSIAPMLLIPFVENAFKHGTGTLEEPIIDISIIVNQNQLLLLVENEVAPVNPSLLAPPKKDSGIGLSNVRRRLELLYPGKYFLETRKEDQLFNVKLLINF